MTNYNVFCFIYGSVIQKMPRLKRGIDSYFIYSMIRVNNCDKHIFISPHYHITQLSMVSQPFPDLFVRNLFTIHQYTCTVNLCSHPGDKNESCNQYAHR